MFLIVVYDTDKKNCVKLHRQLKKYLFWNQNSVFEGTVTRAQHKEIKHILKKEMVESSHIIIYSIENDKLITKEELGQNQDNPNNII